MTHIVANSSNDLQRELSLRLLELGAESEPRGMQTRELLGVSFELSNPRNRLTTLPERKWSAALAVAELAWHLRGDTDVEALAFYTPRWRDFADSSGKVRGSCYGQRIFGKGLFRKSQWTNVKKLLQTDINSRRAVLNFRTDEDVSKPTNDLSCTNTLQFIVRENKLHAFTSMRSNDAIWGVPYDLFLFTTLQELMAVELGLDLGRYHHYAASMHVYERHYALAKRIASHEGEAALGSMPPISSASEVMEMAKEEESIRLHGQRGELPLCEFAELCLSLLESHQKLSAAA